MALKKILVKAGPAANGRVALFERHADHPRGEAYVAGEKPVRVARTSAVDTKLHQQVLVEVNPKELKQGEPSEGENGGGVTGAPTGGAGGGAGS